MVKYLDGFQHFFAQFKKKWDQMHFSKEFKVFLSLYTLRRSFAMEITDIGFCKRATKKLTWVD